MAILVHTMTREVSIIILGLLVAATPFLGFPQRYEEILLILFGLLIVIFALSFHFSVESIVDSEEEQPYEESIATTEDNREE